MLYKNILVGFLMFLSMNAWALDKEECTEAAENIFAAQNVLNSNPAQFKAIHESILADKPESYGWSPELYEFITKLAGKLKPGNDPKKIALVVFEGCLAKAKAI